MLSRLRLLGGRADRGGRFGVLSGTRRFFALSPELVGWLVDESAASELDQALAAEVREEVGRLSRAGFWPSEVGPSVAPSATVTLGMVLATSCNLACRYCNVRDYGLGPSFMDERTVCAAVDFLAAQIHARARSTALLVFFGGEPTLNFDTLLAGARAFRAHLPEPPHDVWVVTNGTLIDAHRARALAEHGILCVVSLDGSEEAHDANRRFAGSDEGSFSAVMRGVEHLQAAQARFVVRATWVPGQGDRLERLAYLRRVASSAMQVTVAIDFHADAKGSAEYLETSAKEWDQFEISGYRGNAPASAAVLVDTVLRADAAPELVCPAGKDGFLVMPSGGIYPCQVLAAQQRLRVGNVHRGGLVAALVEQARAALHVDDGGPACRSCSLSGLCAGPCFLARPLQAPDSNCAMLAMELERACRFAATARVTDLVARYDLGLAAQEMRAAMARGAALREIMWCRNRHLQPLSLCPMPFASGYPARSWRDLPC